MSKKRMTKADQHFYSGVLAALAIVHAHGMETIFHEIVASVGKDEIVAYAKADEQMEFSGMTDYGYADASVCPSCEVPHKPGEARYCAF